MSDLEGLLVVSVEHAVAAPYASCKLADAGARVIKVERPEGDFARTYDQLVHGESAYFIWINRGKESVCLDLKETADLDILRNMLRSADVFIQNLAPGAFDRLGLPIETIRSDNPGLIVCSISGYGTEGSAKDQKAYDLLIQAETGLSSINGTEHGPARVGVSVCDIAAGMTAYQAILQGLIARARTGQGREIEVSLFHAMSDWMNVPYLQYKYGGKKPARMGLKHPTIAPYGAFRCADGKEILISIQNEREWARLCATLLKDPQLPSREGWRTNSERVANRQAVDEAVAQAFAQVPRDRAIEMMQQADIAFGRLSDPDDLVSHPQNRVVTVDVSGNSVDLLAPGALVKGEDTQFRSVPELGRDTQRIREEFSPRLGTLLAGK
ncbi:L-carnitine dehydratase/bile acid-inducible protein F [Dinoroseobacter shibae DFL 12 = DSM 16493]|jgi:crotonobetainyl-CoA:carnitine CoA-transferase CaiB-like acyl-CoA transferase|uniref:L-carnitine dehydratase/bile acid-inducible protein F n=1 Tax=Dinoroseobacter shibae (strain DSM 16493 / NCIMB 14021 / DFL 12) TaxID=398580 RepID=A8LJF2_DINSH|nr:CaiB/BaiF CoA-transferase family protein [Dinoroseobacter shibae]ABV93174.1 L-carnitine dehydratase/bile acid-inducible protein F [Dinoroseobacter shibae DFL 12 = DSM 16493]URF48100.1 CoA transferase [Dinoroseobacter shibae]URF52410.1 CoA transferase [Dinoroseobacter shibae]